jgi:hypothetical protein
MRLTFSTGGGLGQLLDSKVKYIQNALKDGLENIVSVGALPIEQEAKAIVVVDTGALRDSIHTEIEVESPTKALGKIGSGLPYATRIEFGFVGTDSLGRHYNQAAQPYLRPAMDSKGPEALQAMKESTRLFLKEAVDNAYAQASAASLRSRTK